MYLIATGLDTKTKDNNNNNNPHEVLQKGKQTYTHKTSNSCNKCGTKHAFRQGPAFGKQCNRCKRFNHYAKVYNMTDVNNVHTVECKLEGSLFISLI